jgi:nicotinate-nucleotide pyrophosphorylase (carboxylating)
LRNEERSAPSEPDRIDIRDAIFKKVANKKVRAVIWTKQSGTVSGIDRSIKMAKEMKLSIQAAVGDGDDIAEGGTIALIEGTPKEICLAEDVLIGLIGKTSGIATAARRAVSLAGGRVTIVSGGWKKMPHLMKEEIREAIRLGGSGLRITERPFVYLDKNYVRMFGGIVQALNAVQEFEDRMKVIQIRGETEPIVREAVVAAEQGADIIMVDTGDIDDLRSVSSALTKEGLRTRVKIAFGGSIPLEEIPHIVEVDVDILDIGRAIIDAPMLDIRLDVEEVED